MKEDKLLQNRIEEATSRIEDRISTLSGLNDLLGLIYDAVYYSEESCKQKSIAEMKKVPQNLHS